MQQVADWLEKLGLGQYAQRFAENDISFGVLADLTVGSTLGGYMGRQRESQIINPPQIGPGGRSQAKSSGWDENQTSSKAMFLKLNTQRPMGPMPHPGRTAPGPRAGFSTIFRPRSGGVTGYVTSSHRPATPLGRLPSVALRAAPRHPCGGPFKSISLSFAEHPAPIGR